jgi:hypothetical protein
VGLEAGGAGRQRQRRRQIAPSDVAGDGDAVAAAAAAGARIGEAPGDAADAVDGDEAGRALDAPRRRRRQRPRLPPGRPPGSTTAPRPGAKVTAPPPRPRTLSGWVPWLLIRVLPRLPTVTTALPPAISAVTPGVTTATRVERAPPR